MLSSWFLSIVSNAALMSIPEIFMMTSSFSVFAANHLWVQTTSAVLRSGRNPLWLFDRYSSTKGLILFKVMIDKALRNELSRVIGRKLFGGPFFLPGFWMAIRTPVFISKFSCLEKVVLNMSAIVWSSSGVPYFKSSACIWSSPGALLLLKLLKLFLTSSGVIGLFSGFGSPSNGLISSTFSSSNLLLKCEETMSSMSFGFDNR